MDPDCARNSSVKIKSLQIYEYIRTLNKKAMFLLSALVMLSWQNPASPDSLLTETSQKLHAIKRLAYVSTRELNYPSENYLAHSKWQVVCDFDSADTLTGFRYQVEDSSLKEIYNGTEKFVLNKKNMSMEVDDHPVKGYFQRLAFLYNSIITLRNILPRVINDPTITKSVVDTFVNDLPCTQITLNLGKRRIQNLGRGLDIMSTKYNFIYKILLTKSDHMPYGIVQMDDANSDRITTFFTYIQPDARGQDEGSWYYSTYTGLYRRAEEKAAAPLITVGTPAPSWELASQSNTVSLTDFKGQVVLIAFWIKNCSHCIESVPYLNQLEGRFKGRPVKVISINAYDSKNDIAWFCSKYNVRFTVLSNGREVAKEYGVDAFPTFIVIDKGGKVIYTQAGFDPGALSTVVGFIEKAL
jgi:peroxiredoxin